MAQYEDEIAVYPDMSKSEEEIKKQFDANTEAKLRHAARREEERINKKTLFEKAIDKITAMFSRKRAEQLKQQQEDKQR